MAAYAEGMNILKAANEGNAGAANGRRTSPLQNPEYYQFDIDLAAVAEVWRHGSVIGSWLLDLTAGRDAGRCRTDAIWRAGIGLRARAAGP